MENHHSINGKIDDFGWAIFKFANSLPEGIRSSGYPCEWYISWLSILVLSGLTTRSSGLTTNPIKSHETTIFPMVLPLFPWFSYGFPMVFPLFLWVFLWFGTRDRHLPWVPPTGLDVLHMSSANGTTTAHLERLAENAGKSRVILWFYMDYVEIIRTWID